MCKMYRRFFIKKYEASKNKVRKCVLENPEYRLEKDHKFFSYFRTISEFFTVMQVQKFHASNFLALFSKINFPLKFFAKIHFCLF